MRTMILCCTEYAGYRHFIETKNSSLNKKYHIKLNIIIFFFFLQRIKSTLYKYNLFYSIAIIM